MSKSPLPYKVRVINLGNDDCMVEVLIVFAILSYCPNKTIRTLRSSLCFPLYTIQSVVCVHSLKAIWGQTLHKLPSFFSCPQLFSALQPHLLLGCRSHKPNSLTPHSFWLAPHSASSSAFCLFLVYDLMLSDWKASVDTWKIALPTPGHLSSSSFAVSRSKLKPSELVLVAFPLFGWTPLPHAPLLIHCCVLNIESYCG